MRKAQVGKDNKLLKKISDEIWEFRTLYHGLQYRILAFWDKENNEETLVVSTHGFIKKRSKIPDQEIKKALDIRSRYFKEKQINKK
ncbi:MAG: hypothetical protein RL106_1992 [Bacteroidota bacterium]|jgi:hypothetical protein